MNSWKTLAIALMASISTLFPTIVLGGTTAFTVYSPSVMKKAKDDALAFIGSEGEIRGAQFEQAIATTY